MGVYDRLSTFAGLPVADFTGGGAGAVGEPAPAADAVAWRVQTDYEGAHFPEVWAAFLETVETGQVTALIIGFWHADYALCDADPIIALLVESADRFPALRALFFGDIVAEESEITWIEQSDVTPLIKAFPRLEHFTVRGGTGLSLEPFHSDTLTTLRFEAGGLPAAVVRAVAASDLPRLEHLDLWLGIDMYGGDVTVADLEPLLAGERWPALRHLGLEDSEIQDELAVAVASAPVVAGLESLSLAMGVLTDEGAEALLSGQPLTHLRKLDLHFHYLSEPIMARIRAALPGVEVDLRDRQDPDREWRWVSVSE